MKHNTIKILRDFQRWRLGDTDEMPGDDATYPRVLTEAIDDAIAELKKAARVRREIKAVLTENAHLADGKVCTLARLKKLVPEWEMERRG
jgi:hypothetical protein